MKNSVLHYCRKRKEEMRKQLAEAAKENIPILPAEWVLTSNITNMSWLLKHASAFDSLYVFTFKITKVRKITFKKSNVL